MLSQGQKKAHKQRKQGNKKAEGKHINKQSSEIISI
jgi:hypothetical protein